MLLPVPDVCSLRRLPPVDLRSAELVEGQRTDVFRKHSRTELAGRSFSLLYTGRKGPTSLDVVCKDNKEYDLWITGLRCGCEH